MTAAGHSPRWAGSTAALLMVLCIAGCDTTPVHLSLAEPAVRAKAIPANAVQVQLTELLDKRQHAEALGVVGGRVFSAADLIIWVEQSFLSISSPRCVITRNALEPTNPCPTLKANVLKAYVDNVHITKTAVVVIEIELNQPGASEPFKHIYRGQTASVNWAADPDEVTRALKQALMKCIADIQHDIETNIAPKAVAVPRQS